MLAASFLSGKLELLNTIFGEGPSYCLLVLGLVLLGVSGDVVESAVPVGLFPRFAGALTYIFGVFGVFNGGGRDGSASASSEEPWNVDCVLFPLSCVLASSRPSFMFSTFPCPLSLRLPILLLTTHVHFLPCTTF